MQKAVHALIPLLLLLVSLPACAQQSKPPAAPATKTATADAKPPCCQPTELQKLRIENLRLKRQLLLREIAWRSEKYGITELNEGQRRLARELADAGRQVIESNGWPGDVVFSVEEVEDQPDFRRVPKPEDKKPAEKQ